MSSVANHRRLVDLYQCTMRLNRPFGSNLALKKIYISTSILYIVIRIGNFRPKSGFFDFCAFVGRYPFELAEKLLTYRNLLAWDKVELQCVTKALC